MWISPVSYTIVTIFVIIYVNFPPPNSPVITRARSARGDDPVRGTQSVRMAGRQDLQLTMDNWAGDQLCPFFWSLRGCGAAVAISRLGEYRSFSFAEAILVPPPFSFGVFRGQGRPQDGPYGGEPDLHPELSISHGPLPGCGMPFIRQPFGLPPSPKGEGFGCDDR